MASVDEEAGKLSVFISYSRDDFDFADQLDAALNALGFSTILDRHGISGGEDWKHRLGNLIRDADTVVFVLSPSSAGSEICAWEVQEAIRLGKRIIPVLCRSLDGASAPPQLSDLNYIFFYAEPKSPGSGFGTGQARLVAALNTDLDWLREHTRYLQRASEWDAGGRPRNRLLSGADIGLAKAWAERRPKNAPAPTALHLDYIKASEEWDRQQQSAERQRLQQIAEAQAAREAALAEKEIAQQREAEGSRRLVQRTLIGLVGALVLAVLAGAFGIYAWQQRSEAKRQEREAEKATLLAIETRNEALLNQSRFLTSSASQVNEQGDATAGLLLALEAMPDEKSDDKTLRTRPYWPQAEASLVTALRDLRERVILKGHTGLVLSVAMTQDGKRIVTGSDDDTVRVWDATTGRQVLQLQGHSNGVNDVAVTPDGTRIITGGNDNLTRIWDAGTGKELLVLKGHTSRIRDIAVTPDGSRIVTASEDNTARVWDAGTGTQLLELRGHSNQVHAVAVTPDGNSIVTGSSDTTVRIWNAKTGTELRQLKGHIDDVHAVAVTPDGARIVTGSSDKTARVWDARTGTELHTLTGHAGRVYALAMTPDGAHIITGAWGAGPVRVWDANKGTELFQLKGHEADVNGVAVSPDGSRVVTGSDDSTARIWELVTGRELFQLNGHKRAVNVVAASMDGTRLFTGSADNTARVWDAKTGAEVLQLSGHSGGIFALAVTRDGSRVITGSGDDTVRVWDARTGAQLLELTGHTGTIYGLAVTQDGSRIISGSDDNTARVWDASTGKELVQLKGHSGRVFGVAVTPDGSRIVTGAWGRNPARVWDAQTGKELFELKGHGSDVNGVAVTPDGSRFVTGSDDGTVRIWDSGTGKELLQLRGHIGYVYGVAVTPDGGRIVSGADDTTVRVWSAKTGKELLQLKGHASRVIGVALAPDGKRIVTGSDDSTARVWALLPAGQALVEEAKSVVPRCLTPAERQRFYLAPTPSRWCASLQKWPYDDVAAFIEGGRLAAAGQEEEAAAVLDTALARDPSAAKRIDKIWADGYVTRGRALTSKLNDEEATAMFAKAMARDPTAAQRIDAAWVNAYIDRGIKLVNERSDEKASSAFAEALARDPGVAKRVDRVWVNAYVSRGRNLAAGGKDDEAASVFELALKRDPSVVKRIDETWVNVYVERGRQLVANGREDEAKTVFAKAMTRDSSIAKVVDEAWFNAYIDRGRALVVKGAEDEAKAAFAKALSRDPTAAKRIDQTWMDASINRANTLLNEARGEQAGDPKRKEALAIFERAIAHSQSQNLGRSALADAIMGRGRAHDALKQYVSAATAFKEAMALGHKDADHWLFWTTDRLSDQTRDEQKKPVHALLMANINYLDLTPELRNSIGLRALKFNASTWTTTARLFADLQGSSAAQTDCDRLTAHSADPLRLSPGVVFETIPLIAVAACEQEVKQQPQEGRYLYQHARALSRAADLNRDEKSTAKADAYDASAVAGFKAAMAAGYPMAFSNMALAFQNARGVAKDEDKAADLYLETFNRVIHCCWVPVARHVLEQEAQHDLKAVRRVVHELLMWADALGSQEAKTMLGDLYAKGTLERPHGRPAIGRVDFTSLPPWLK